MPVVNNDTDVPATEHTAPVRDENDTGRPDDAVALTDTGDCDSVAFASGPNEIDCGEVVPPDAGRRISTAVKFHRSVVGAVSFIVTLDPTAPVGEFADCTQKVSPETPSTH